MEPSELQGTSPERLGAQARRRAQGQASMQLEPVPVLATLAEAMRQD
jgi:hypothetical protein